MSSHERSDSGPLGAAVTSAGRRLGLVAGLLVVLALLVTACGPAAEPIAPPPAVEEGMPVPGESPVPEMIVTAEPSVTVADQPIDDGQVTIAEVVSDGFGWLVVHAQAGGAPGPILGYTQVAGGSNAEVVVEIDVAGATETLYAMLHTDAGTAGAWEFPDGPDVPVRVGEQVVTPAFMVTGGLAADKAPAAESPAAAEAPAAPAVTEPDQGLVGSEGTVAEVEIEDFQFQPRALVIRVGTTVRWSNKDAVAHTATSDTGLWDSGYLDKGDEFSFTFTDPGTYPYYCIPHGGPGGQGMSGTVTVVE